jgi:hypothetical protein
MPVAASDLDGYALPREGNIQATPGPRGHRVLDAVAIPTAVELTSQAEFGRSVLSPHRSHPPSDLG